MDDSSSAFASEKPHKKIQDDTHFHSGIHIPQHMLSPGQDGYRTPTIEDYEKQQHGDPSNPHGKHHNHHLLRINSGHLAHNIIDHLHWKERIRHFTWTFFAMTMATGGIANVLYSGKLCIQGVGGLIRELTQSMHSTLPIPRPRRHWRYLLPSQYGPLHFQRNDDVPTLLLPLRLAHGILSTSHRKTLHTCGRGLVRNSPTQYISVWPRPHW